MQVTYLAHFVVLTPENMFQNTPLYQNKQKSSNKNIFWKVSGVIEELLRNLTEEWFCKRLMDVLG